MDPVRLYDYLAHTRLRLFDWVRPLSAEAYGTVLPGWSRSLARLLTHVLASEGYYLLRLQRQEVPPYEDWPIREEEPPDFPVLEERWTEQAPRTRAVLTAVRDWTAELEYRVTDDDGRGLIVTASPADLASQLVLHEVHHRGQAMSMLRQLGVALEDIDFNATMYRRRPA